MGLSMKTIAGKQHLEVMLQGGPIKTFKVVLFKYFVFIGVPCAIVYVGIGFNNPVQECLCEIMCHSIPILYSSDESVQ